MLIEAIKASDYDLTTVNDNAPYTSDKRTVAELIQIIRQAQEEIEAGLQALDVGEWVLTCPKDVGFSFQ